MSLLVCVWIPTGIVLSGDSRTTASRVERVFDSERKTTRERHVTFTVSDAAEKVFLIHDRFGIGAIGTGIIQGMPVAHYIRRFVATRTAPQNTRELAVSLRDYFRSISPIPQSALIVLGYDNGEPWIGRVDVAEGVVDQVNRDINGGDVFFGGDTSVVERLVSERESGTDFRGMNLQDAVDYSRHLIRTTVDQMRFEMRSKTVGGPIDTLVATPEGVAFAARKQLGWT